MNKIALASVFCFILDSITLFIQDYMEVGDMRENVKLNVSSIY